MFYVSKFFCLRKCRRRGWKRIPNIHGLWIVDSANSATSQTLGAPEPPTQDDATPTETPVAVAGLPSVYLMMPKQPEQATHLREAKEIRRSLLAWSRQAIAICSIILVAGVVLTMLAITLIAKDSCKAVKEI